jgi:hypothetical protein
MNCTRTHKVLALYVGGDLPLAQMQQVADHLVTCAECRQEEATWVACRADLQTLAVPASDSPLGLWADLESHLDVVDAVNRHQRRKLLRPWSWGALAAAGALLSLPFWWQSPSPSVPSSDSMVVLADPLLDPPAGLIPVPDRVLKEFLIRNSALMGHSPFGLSADVAQPASLQEKDL